MWAISQFLNLLISSSQTCSTFWLRPNTRQILFIPVVIFKTPRFLSIYSRTKQRGSRHVGGSALFSILQIVLALSRHLLCTSRSRNHYLLPASPVVPAAHRQRGQRHMGRSPPQYRSQMLQLLESTSCTVIVCCTCHQVRKPLHLLPCYGRISCIPATRSTLSPTFPRLRSQVLQLSPHAR
jgi:hypothetical protein